MKDVKKYHGYLVLPRHAKLIQEDLGYHLFSLYIALIMDARWFRGNVHFSHVVGTQIEIADRFGISQASLSRNLDKLYSRKYILKHKGYIVLKYFPLFLKDVAEKMYKNDYTDLYELYADMYRINTKLQENYAKTKLKQPQNTSQSLYSSSKDDLGSFLVSNNGEFILDTSARAIENEDEKGGDDPHDS